MGNLAAARSVLSQQGIAMESLPVRALESTTWYRGGAVGVTIDSATAGNIGYATPTLDGTVAALFAGVLKRSITVPASTDTDYARKRQLPLHRQGAILFNAVTTAGNAATVDASWLWKPVWFVSDNEVSLTPPSQQYPIRAGRVIGINGMLGCSQVGSTEVLVAISDAVNQAPCAWSYFPVAASLVMNTTNVDVFRATATLNRWFIRRAIAHVVTAPNTGTIKFSTLRDTGSGASTTNFGGAATTLTTTGAGYVTARAINSIFNIGDTLTVNVESNGNTTAGQALIAIEYMPLI